MIHKSQSRPQNQRRQMAQQSKLVSQHSLRRALRRLSWLMPAATD